MSGWGQQQHGWQDHAYERARADCKRRAYDEFVQYFMRNERGVVPHGAQLGEYSQTDTDSATSIFIPLLHCREMPREFRDFLEAFPGGSAYKPRNNYETDAVMHYVEVTYQAPRQQQRQMPMSEWEQPYESPSTFSGVKLYGMVAVAVVAICCMTTPDVGAAARAVFGW